MFEFAERMMQSLFDKPQAASGAGPRAARPGANGAPGAGDDTRTASGLPPVDLFGVVDAPEKGALDAASMPKVAGSPGEVLDAIGVGPNPMDPKRATDLLGEVGATDKKLKSKFFTGGRESSPDPTNDEEEIAEKKAAGKYVFESAAAGEVRPYEGQQGDAVSSYSVAGKDGGPPVIRVATGERAIAVVKDGEDPRMVSTDFSHCGGTVLRGKDANGNIVLMVGHVSHQDDKGHYARLADDIAELKARGITDLQAVVVPGGDPENGAAIPAQEEMAKNPALDGVELTVVPRPEGTDKEAHLVVTKEGVAVFAGALKGDEAKVVGSHQFAGEKSFAQHTDEGAKPYVEGMEKALAKTPEGQKVLDELTSRGGAALQITTERGKGSFRDGNRINIDPDAAGDNWRKMASELVEQMSIDPQPSGDTPEARSASAARNAAEARVARIEHNLDEGFGPDASLPGSREYDRAFQAAVAAGASDAQARAAGVQAVAAVLEVAPHKPQQPGDAPKEQAQG